MQEQLASIKVETGFYSKSLSFCNQFLGQNDSTSQNKANTKLSCIGMKYCSLNYCSDFLIQCQIDSTYLEGIHPSFLNV